MAMFVATYSHPIANSHAHAFPPADGYTNTFPYCCRPRNRRE